jgi:hypothetical protein
MTATSPAQIHSEAAWCRPGRPAESAVESADLRKTESVSNFRKAQRVVGEQLLGGGDTPRVDQLAEGQSPDG